MFRDALARIDASTIVVNINSPGGDVFDGIAIYNDLLAHKAEVVIRVTGLAASAASLVAMAGDEITIAENAFFMIHNAWTFAIGDSREMTAQAKILKQVDGSLAETYAARTGQDVGDIRSLMDDETWLNGDDAVEQGFADKIISADEPAGADARASFGLAAFKNVPRALKPRRMAKAKSKVDPVVEPEAPATDFSSVMAGLNSLSVELFALAL